MGQGHDKDVCFHHVHSPGNCSPSRAERREREMRTEGEGRTLRQRSRVHRNPKRILAHGAETVPVLVRFVRFRGARSGSRINRNPLASSKKLEK